MEFKMSISRQFDRIFSLKPIQDFNAIPSQEERAKIVLKVAAVATGILITGLFCSLAFTKAFLLLTPFAIAGGTAYSFSLLTDPLHRINDFFRSIFSS